MTTTPMRTAPGSAAAFRAPRKIRSHRRSGASRAELIAAGFGGAAALLLLQLVEKKVTGRA